MTEEEFAALPEAEQVKALETLREIKAVAPTGAADGPDIWKQLESAVKGEALPEGMLRDFVGSHTAQMAGVLDSTFGIPDAIIGALGGAGAREKYQNLIQTAKNQDQVMAGGAQLAGAVAGGAGAAKAGTALSSAMAGQGALKAGGLLDLLGQGAAGAVAGGADSALRGNSADEAGLSALLGGVLGSGGAFLGAHLGKLVEPIFRSKDAATVRAAEKLTKDLPDETAGALSLDSLKARAVELGPDARIMDLDPRDGPGKLLSEVASAYKKGATPETRGMITAALNRPLDEAADEALTAALGTPVFRSVQAKNLQEGLAKLQPRWQEAMAAADDAVTKTSPRGLAKKPYEAAVTNAFRPGGSANASAAMEQAEGEARALMFRVTRGGNDPLLPSSLVKIRQGLDELIDRIDADPTATTSAKSVRRALSKVRGTTADWIKGMSPELKALSADYASEFEANRAMDLGEKMLKATKFDAEDMLSEYEALSASGKIAFEHGLSRGVRQKIATSPDDPAALMKLAGNRPLMDKLTSVVGTERAGKILRASDKAATFTNSKRAIDNASKNAVGFPSGAETGMLVDAVGAPMQLGMMNLASGVFQGAARRLGVRTSAQTAEDAADMVARIGSMPASELDDQWKLLEMALTRQAKRATHKMNAGALAAGITPD